MEAYKTGENAYDLLGIGDAGCWARIGANTSVTIYDMRLHCYYGDVREGGTIIDKRPAFEKDWGACCHLVCSGPMVDMSLDNGMVKKLFDKPSVFDGDAGAMDMVSLDIYLDNWRALGAKVGHRRGNVVKWEDGSVEEIVEESKRYAR